eukprot:CAMPEP_0170593424 /NCGR_PEP_ID=MMETSP0224-20130122/13441_1 /TAXON_ID=285029 /ORGANISM="Togula jolla, Strain CCCM 725" /LENGTH=462 /DNA_ID=CAMNT_0010917377 /DNA_START=93 /DNA_END=1481 /DNA_ORIENTATION=+
MQGSGQALGLGPGQGARSTKSEAAGFEAESPGQEELSFDSVELFPRGFWGEPRSKEKAMQDLAAAGASTLHAQQVEHGVCLAPEEERFQAAIAPTSPASERASPEPGPSRKAFAVAKEAGHPDSGEEEEEEEEEALLSSRHRRSTKMPPTPPRPTARRSEPSLVALPKTPDATPTPRKRPAAHVPTTPVKHAKSAVVPPESAQKLGYSKGEAKLQIVDPAVMTPLRPPRRSHPGRGGLFAAVPVSVLRVASTLGAEKAKDSPDGCRQGPRRSLRSRCRPLEAWRNERVLYERPKGSKTPSVVGVLLNRAEGGTRQALPLPVLQVPAVGSAEAGTLEFVGLSVNSMESRILYLPAETPKSGPVSVVIPRASGGVLHVLNGSVRLAREGAGVDQEMTMARGDTARLPRGPRRLLAASSGREPARLLVVRADGRGGPIYRGHGWGHDQDSVASPVSSPECPEDAA